MNLIIIILFLIIYWCTTNNLLNNELFGNTRNNIIIKKMNNNILSNISINEYINLSNNTVFRGHPKVKIIIPNNYNAEITYKYTDYTKLFAFKLQLPQGQHIIEKDIKDTMIDKIIIQKNYSLTNVNMIMIKDFNGNIIYINDVNKPINWEAIRFATKYVKPVYGTNAIVDVYYGEKKPDNHHTSKVLF
jgi:hypothetical protein